MPNSKSEQVNAERRRLAFRRFMQTRKLSVNGWAERAGVSESGIRSFLKAESEPGTRVLQKLADVENVTVGVLLGEETIPTDKTRGEKVLPKLSSARRLDIPEIEMKAGMGPGQLPDQVEHPKEMWSTPLGFFGRGASDLIIHEVEGDSMLPVLESGDRVVVHIADRIPSPAGIFAIFDGHGIMVKHVSTVPQSKPMRINVRSSNTVYPPEEWQVEEDTIVGRVKGVIRRF
ncbi:MAG: hypothetical protein IPK59_10430 [Rhodospirillaceae bacterium]|nr:hypothetical protein [Rhodospirillaceae bacterium]